MISEFYWDNFQGCKLEQRIFLREDKKTADTHSVKKIKDLDKNKLLRFGSRPSLYKFHPTLNNV